MKRLQYTLVTDGSSDRLLKYPIEWLLERLTPLDIYGQWADPQVFAESEITGLYGRLLQALGSYPCQLLFVHRDAENEPRQTRVEEIEEAVRRVSTSPPAVCVVPVRMTEAWLLIDEPALRLAAGNPNGRVDLSLPPIENLEKLPDPKQMLFDLLKTATELPRRRMRRFNEGRARQQLAELMDDYAPLETLPAFQAFRRELKQVLAQHGWDGRQHDANP